jgi:hypothetical protein
MVVYVVKEVCDEEYGCSDVVMVTTNKAKAEGYVSAHNYKWEHWSGGEYDGVFFEEWEVEE